MTKQATLLAVAVMAFSPAACAQQWIAPRVAEPAPTAQPSVGIDPWIRPVAYQPPGRVYAIDDSFAGQPPIGQSTFGQPTFGGATSSVPVGGVPFGPVTVGQPNYVQAPMATQGFGSPSPTQPGFVQPTYVDPSLAQPHSLQSGWVEPCPPMMVDPYAMEGVPVLAWPGHASADAGGEAFALSRLVLPPGSPWGFGFWTQLGYHTSQTPLSTTFGDVLSTNDVPDQLNLQQQWFWVQRKADGARGLDWGVRFDILYGTDAQKTQAFGNDDPHWDFSSGFIDREYGIAMPQAYLEVAAGDWSVIGGHFFSISGYESVPAPDNFFYSHSLTLFNSEPYTHTGVLSRFDGFEDVSVYAGWTLGWDTGFDQYTQNGARGSNFLGGISVDLIEGVKIRYTTTVGDFGVRSDASTYGGPAGVNDHFAYAHFLVLDFALSQQLNYVLQNDMVSVRNGVGHDQVGINQYLLYAINEVWGAGIRVEWWKNDGQSFYETTLGVNFRPLPNIVVRPEIRYDWTPSAVGYGDGRTDETTFGIDAVATY